MELLSLTNHILLIKIQAIINHVNEYAKNYVF